MCRVRMVCSGRNQGNSRKMEAWGKSDAPGLFSGFFFFFFFSSFTYISWRLITLQYCSGFCHTLTWISHGFTCVPDPPSLFLPHPIPLGHPSALFIIARTWKQPRCPSADEWIRKLWYIYTMEYYSAIKKNTFESVLIRWMKRAHYTEWSKPERKTPIQ